MGVEGQESKQFVPECVMVRAGIGTGDMEILSDPMLL
jgi:hypothetical protein